MSIPALLPAVTGKLDTMLYFELGLLRKEKTTIEKIRPTFLSTLSGTC
jgi:hypothetical protein